MPLTDLIFGINRVEVGSLTLDAAVSEEHSSEVAVTDHPVEQGIDISDNKRRLPRRLRIVGVVSNTPIELLGGGLAAGNRDLAAWEVLKALQAGAELITVVTTLETYEDMVIEKLSVPRDAARGNSLHVTIELRELRQVSSETVAAPTETKDLGRVTTKPAPAPAAQESTFLLNAFGG